MTPMTASARDRVAAHLTKVTVAQQVAATLRQEIVGGQLQAGSKLRQVEIARRLGVSTTPVREAFGLLQSEGLVQIDTHRGVTVFLPTRQGLVEHYEIRAALEMLAVEKAAEAFGPEDAAPLTELLDEMETLASAPRYVECNRAFHMRLYALADRPQLLAMIEELRNASSAYLHLYAARDIPGDSPRLNREHREILAACQANDPQRAAGALRHHFQQMVLHVLQVLEEEPERRKGGPLENA